MKLNRHNRTVLTSPAERCSTRSKDTGTLSAVTRRFAKSERGNIAMMTSVAMLVVISVAGAAVDFSMASSSTSQSQNIADAVALNAAIHMRVHGEIPDGTNGGVKPGTYTAKELGYGFQNWVDDDDSKATVTIAYDEVNGQAIVTVQGTTLTTFSSIMGKKGMEFSSKATVSFESLQLRDVASVALVLDNSGSMQWMDKAHNEDKWGNYTAPTGAVSRIDALKTSVNGFMSHLGKIVEDQGNGNPKIVRTGMLAYNSDTINSRTKSMKWKLLSNSDVKHLGADGGTNSSNAMQTAKTWIQGEDAIHMAENEKTPLKYVIFMTDGVNNNNGSQWVEASGGGIWRRERCYFKKKHKNKQWKWNCYSEEKTSTSKPSGSVGYVNNNKGYDYAWIEGRITMPDNEETLKYCQQMKDAGATVYTIGFALEEGVYGGGEWGGTVWQDASSTEIAYDFLSECASKPSTFIKAENAEKLNEAFETIGDQIISEVIRITS